MHTIVKHTMFDDRYTKEVDHKVFIGIQNINLIILKDWVINP
jgi:hypothetical protein